MTWPMTDEASDGKALDGDAVTDVNSTMMAVNVKHLGPLWARQVRDADGLHQPQTL